jgi:hypothetical protein
MFPLPPLNNAADYIAFIKRLIQAEPSILAGSMRMVKERARGEAGHYRYRLRFVNGDFLEISEYFTIKSGQVEIETYSFHWQDAKGALRKRWDNAPHHSHLSTAPHHLHDGAEENVLPHPPMSAVELLQIVSASRSKTT